MIRWCSILVALIWTIALYGQNDNHRDFLPPYNFRVDSVSLLATWEAPKIVLLQEDFEGNDFLPAGWAATSLGYGWRQTGDPDFWFWHYPVPDGNFVVTNDDLTYSNNGSMDYLYTPVMDLTVADSFKLYFDSYFDGGYGEQAFLEYTLDRGATWQLLKQLDASLEWEKMEVDLSQFSSPGGEADFKLAFHAADNGYFASGWVIDNVVIYSGHIPDELSGYRIFLDSEEIAQVNSTSFHYDFEYSQIHDCGIQAVYQEGFSDTIWENVRSFYLPKPDSLGGYAPDDAVILMWVPPADNEYLVGYNIYRNDSLVGNIESNDTICCGYVDPVTEWQGEGATLYYEVSALYDLSEYGIAGDTGESLREGPAYVYLPLIYTGLDLFEDFSSGSVDYYEWPVIDSNWAIDLSMGNIAPCIVFQPNTLLLHYEQMLKSCLIFTHLAGDVILEYDISLSSVNPSGDEKLLVQVYDYLSSTWQTVESVTNEDGSFGWRHDSLNITPNFNESFFKVRFNAQGENSGDIIYWAVDNISIRNECYSPQNVQASLKPPSVDSVLVTWNEPFPARAEWRRWNDGVLFTKFGFGVSKGDWSACAARWIPEQLAELKDATLTAIGFIPGEGSAFYKIAAWAGDNKDLVYEQAAGNLIIDEWNIIPLEVPLKIDITKDLLVGYRFAEYMNFPMTTDNGPAIDGLGNLIQFGISGSWETFLENGYDYNWNIKAYFEMDGVPADSYQLFRSLDGNEPEMITEVEDLEYIDTVSSGYITSCYKLKSVFDYGCESDFSEEACVIFTNTDPVELKNDGFLKIFPNPATDLIHVQSSEKIQSICIYDNRGDKVIRWEGDKVEMGIPVNELVPGLYLVRVETRRGTVAKKVVIRR